MVIGKNTKMYERIKNLKVKYKTLHDAYKKPSWKKQKAYEYCVDLQNDLNGFNGGICSKNVNFFSYIFEYVENNKHYKMYITASYNRIIELEDDRKCTI